MEKRIIAEIQASEARIMAALGGAAPAPVAARVAAPAPAPVAENKTEVALEADLEVVKAQSPACLLYTSDAADEEDSVDLGGRRIIKKKKKEKLRWRISIIIET
eukprot:TRINITY_DN145_c0_g1_i2.p1 TRINITY_DN145_c0_g1~~TRINITY_DN145_c0_g1_i2.p1  ORF type:complete len:104 (-),score=15.92 TRINITY_DN145_c0_g1_i2:37-348(-)